MSNIIVTVGELSGRVWRHLAAEGEQSIAQVVTALEDSADRVCMAVGWLAREGKINMKSVDGSILIALKENDENW
jgi:hypothetical protein